MTIKMQNELKYKCIVLDHDDTIVKSTPDIHYPSFIEALKIIRPQSELLTLEEFVTYCFEPGFNELCKDILKFTEDEQERQYNIWRSYTSQRIPDFYEGFADFIVEYKKLGGIVAVVSHSESDLIKRDYKANCNLTPDIVFGWELEEHLRKPSPYPLQEIMRRFDLKCDELIVLDDLKPGLDMARSCNIRFAAAGWSHIVPSIKNYMKENSDYYFLKCEEFIEFIMSQYV